MISEQSLKKQQLERERKFEEEFTRHGFKKVPVEGDGNCAYRAVRKLCLLVMALYGTDKFHFKLRQFVAEYHQAEIGFYKQFISNPPGPETYIRRVRTDGVWADDIELQIMSEIYDCSIEIYSESTNPIKIFNENPKAINMRVRLHYLGSCHYDIIWDSRRTSYPLQGHAFGNVESSSVDHARERNKNKQMGAPHALSQDPTSASRLYFEKLMTKNLVQATTNSLSSLEKDFDDLTKGVMKEHETQMTEEEILKSVMAQSIKDAYSLEKPQSTSQYNKNTKIGTTAQKPNMGLIIQLTSMGYEPMECQRAMSQLPTTATISQIIDKIQSNRENQLLLFY